MQYPLQITFKLIALAPQIYVKDANGQLQLFIKQKLLKLREDVRIFRDADQTQEICSIRADRIIDFSARYLFLDTAGREFGFLKRQGLKSLWRSHYEISDGTTTLFTVREENPWVKMADALLDGIPIISLFSGYFCNPKYLLCAADGTPVIRLKKEQAFFEGRFSITKLTEISTDNELRAVLGLLMMTLLERQRG